MVAAGLESVLVGHPVDGVDDAVVAGERVAAPRHGTEHGLALFVEELPLRDRLLALDAVFAVEAEVDGAVGVDVLGLAQDGDRLLGLLKFGGQGSGHGDQSGQQDLPPTEKP